MKRYNYVKISARIIKWGSSYDNILSSVANLWSVTKTTEDLNDSILQDINPISYENLKDAFIHMGVKIIGLPDLKNQMVTL